MININKKPPVSIALIGGSSPNSSYANLNESMIRSLMCA
ncbi:hypothetical protein ymoll0001_5040 [Yersinia mollaretii ATCC 43969]|uniref:Uncharacterized protein n=1 Tax=Yersinia mollaretii (strain ATCC 43969 / DSM 18520 / CIP 103324 / CNY 7263 / WAIP 204) TaxID=349967 RepID=A0ABP2EHF1_YERMW|nr:hypothetical protein ymoll0001_5040 [Yersinia mollaretii ATCC 43969]